MFVNFIRESFTTKIYAIALTLRAVQSDRLKQILQQNSKQEGIAKIKMFSFAKNNNHILLLCLAME